MADDIQGRIALDEIVESASAGVLRALAARDVVAQEFTRRNGFSVRFVIEAGGFPGPIDQFRGGRQGVLQDASE